MNVYKSIWIKWIILIGEMLILIEYILIYFMLIFFLGGGDNVVCMVYLNFLFECNYDIK